MAGADFSFQGLLPDSFTSSKRSMSELKSSKQQAPVSTPVQASSASAPLPRAPAASPAAADPSFCVDQLDTLLTKSASRSSLGAGRSPSVSSLSSRGDPAPGRLDDLDSIFGKPVTIGSSTSSAPAAAAMPAAPVAATAPADPWDLLGSVQPAPQRPAKAPAATSSPAAALDDPLGDLLGGFVAGPAPGPTPAPTRAAPASHRGSAQPTRSAAAPPAPAVAPAVEPLFAAPQRPEPAAAVAGPVESVGSGGFGDFVASEDSEAPQQQPSRWEQLQGYRQASPPRRAHPSPAASAPSPASLAAQRVWQDAEGMPPQASPAAPAAGSGRVSPLVGSQTASPPPARHKAFDYLDAHEQQQQQGQSRRSDPRYDLGGGSGRQRQDHYPHPHHTSAAATAAEVKQKAAKMLHAGTQWFMRASKTLVKDLQTGIARHQAQRTDSSTSTASSTPPYYYDWAAQLTRLSPGSRSAALGAMGEDDRLVVQRIIDEAALGETYLGDQVQGQGEREGEREREREGGRGQGYGGGYGGAGAVAEGPHQRQQQQYQERYGEQYPEQHEEQQYQRRPPSRAPSATASPVQQRPLEQQQQQQRAGGSVAAHRASPAARAPRSPAPAAAEADLLGFDSAPAQRPSSRAAAAAAAAAVPQQPASAAPSGDDDLLGFGTGPAASPSRPAAAAPSMAAASDSGEDLLGLHSTPSRAAAAPSSAGPARHANIEDMFTVPRPGSSSRGGSASAAAAGPARRPAAPPARPSASPLDSMIDLGAELPAAVDVGDHAQLYQDAEQHVEDPNEPEIRKLLRQRRIQEKHQRMQRQLAEKRAREELEASEKAGKVELREQLKPKIDSWAAGKKDNIRALLSSLHTVLWEDSGWTAPNMSDMVDNHKVKRIYMKANLIVHPDKVKQKGGTLEQITIADMVFDVLKSAWGKFEASG